MGSLMAGWDSPTSDPNSVKFRRNKSLTKEGIESFWNTKKRKEEEHLRDISLLSPRTRDILFEEAASNEAGKELLDLENASKLEKLIQKNGWWISSNSAFLNEPPVIALEGSNKSMHHNSMLQPVRPRLKARPGSVLDVCRFGSQGLYWGC